MSSVIGHVFDKLAILKLANHAKPQQLGIPNWWNTMPQYREEILKGRNADPYKVQGNKFWDEIGESPVFDRISQYNMLLMNKTNRKARF